MDGIMNKFVPPLDWPHYGIGFVPAVKRAFQKYATFSGRASRSEYWCWVLANLVVVVGLYGLIAALGLLTRSNGNDFGMGAVPPTILLVVWMFGVLVPNIAITVRRLHDAGYSGWFYLLNLIPYLGGLVVIILCAMQTSPLAAKYGPPYPDYGPGFPQGGYGQPTYANQGQEQWGYGPTGQQFPQGQAAGGEAPQQYR